MIPGLDSIRNLFLRRDHDRYVRCSFFASDAALRPTNMDMDLVVALFDRDSGGQGRVLGRALTGRIIRANGMIPVCIYGYRKGSGETEWNKRICYVYEWLFEPIGWRVYEGPYRKQSDHRDWFKMTLLWTPDREKRPEEFGANWDNWKYGASRQETFSRVVDDGGDE